MNTETTTVVNAPCAEALPVAQVSKPAVSQASEPAPLDEINAVSKPKRRHRPHRSKISELPTAIRDFVNESLHDHVPHKKIIQSLCEKGQPAIAARNLSNWTKSGYKVWLQERESLQCLSLKVDTAGHHIDHIKADGVHKPNRLNGLLVDIQLTQALRDFDPNLLKELLGKDPLHFFKIVRATHSRTLDRHRDQRLDVIREKAGIGCDAGPTEYGRQSVKAAFNLPDSWLPTPSTPVRSS